MISTPLQHVPELKKITLNNGRMYAEILNYGARIMSIYLPHDGHGMTNVVLTYADPAEYLSDPYYLGSTIGRYAGRIRSGKLPLDGDFFQLALNENDKHHLHGGNHGLDRHFFDITGTQTDEKGSSVTLTTFSPHGEQGYPGNLELSVTYTLTHSNSILIEYSATSDQVTHLNITNHTYFNLPGSFPKALDQRLMIVADEFLETTADYIPTGKICRVISNPRNFYISAAISQVKQQSTEKPLNEYYILNGDPGPAAILKDPVSNRSMELFTSYPFLVFYSGDYLGQPFIPCAGVCLEAQYAPDSPTLFSISPTVLRPGHRYQQSIEFRFSW